MITSLIEIPELPNFGHLTTSTIKFKSCDKLVGDVMNRNYDVVTFFQNTFILRRPGLAKFADIIKVATMLIKTTYQNSNKVKRIRNYVLKRNLCLYFLI